MTLRELATLMGVDALVTDPQQLVDAMAAKWNEYAQKMKAALMKKAGNPAAPPGTPAPAPAAPAAPNPMAMSFAETLGDNRRGKLNELVREGRVTPAVVEKLAAQYCDADELVLSLSADGEIDDNFEEVIGALSLNEPYVRRGEKSGRQVVPLDSKRHAGPQKGSLVKDAENRMAAARG